MGSEVDLLSHHPKIHFYKLSPKQFGCGKTMGDRRWTHRLQRLLEEHRLYHVKTLCSHDAPGALEWLGCKRVDRCEPRRDGETLVFWFQRLCELCGVDLDRVEICSVDAEPSIQETTERLVVCVDKMGEQNPWALELGSLVLFLTVARSNSWTKKQEVRSLCAAAVASLGADGLGFESISQCRASHNECAIRPKKQGSTPVLRSIRPESYDTVPPKTSMMTVDSFGQLSEPEEPTRSSEKWTLRALPSAVSADMLDIESLVRDSESVLGSGGFGVTVRIDEGLVAKVNLFPEMLNWSLPTAGDEFTRYAHVATQMEELLIGVSIKHPNVLRTFGGLWCEAPGYPLGGRVVLFMEEAVCSLQEFSARMGPETRYVPLAELDVLRGLEYLQSRVMQHRDITHRNILVCHAESRRPLPLTFKISDFGTACNFSTPDQPRGTRANRAPEVLWCLESDTQADVFSWYCMIWELYSGTPLIGYRPSGRQSGFCIRTYAKNMSELLGSYQPKRGAALFSEYMKRLDAKELCHRYASRPQAQDVTERLEAMAAKAKESNRGGPDSEFVAIGALCVTLFPQERWAPSELLDLPRYRGLVADPVPVPAMEIPTDVSVGCYKATDAVACQDCEPYGFSFVATPFDSQSKDFYGIDLLRLAPNHIQPYRWYARKANGSSPASRSQVIKETGKRRAPSHQTPCEGAQAKVRVSERADLRHAAILEPDGGFGENAERGGHSAEGRRPIAPMQIGTTDSRTASDSATTDGPRVVVKGIRRSCEGEVDTKVVVLTRASPTDVVWFREHVVELSLDLTEKRPDLFAGPIRGLCRSSENPTGAVVFQYATMLPDCKKASEWTPDDAPYSSKAFAAQLLLTLWEALQDGKLPARTLNLDEVFMCHGCALIDPVAYLVKHFGSPGTFFGTSNEGLLALCVDVLGRQSPREAESIRSIGSSDPTAILTGALGSLGESVHSGRAAVPRRLALDSSFFTFKEYTVQRSPWPADACRPGSLPESGCGLGLLVFGDPPPRRGNQAAQGPPSDSKSLTSLIRNLTLRLKARLFARSNMEVVALNCTGAPLTVYLNRAELHGVTGVEGLCANRLQLSGDGRCYTHDADPRVRLALLKWAPVVMISKHVSRGPVPELNKDYFKIVVVLARLCGSKTSKCSLVDLFARLSALIVSSHLHC
ncbi:uncharacterized protein LOC112141767 [Oryzias melastigma]|uniref:uncharacterized protein LOC112141767 n=1 Tax=Oryzias melastigma TaxID=30732 RepID=UPI00168D3D0A|nr:uncharacterized protein LOC112141767 [Oryzias melastigma]